MKKKIDFFINNIINLPYKRRLILIFFDALIIAISFLIYSLIYPNNQFFNSTNNILWQSLGIIFLSLIIFIINDNIRA